MQMADNAPVPDAGDAAAVHFADAVGAVGAGAPPPPAAAENPIHGVLRTCGVAHLSNRMTFINIEGLDSLNAFTTMNGDSNVTEMVKRMASRPAAAGRVILGTIQIKRIQALVYWVKDQVRKGMTPEPEMWTAEAMAHAMERKEAEHNYGKIDVDIIDPGKCQTNHGWDNWQIAFVNKLNATMGTANVPLDYVVRPELEDEDDILFLEEDEEVRYRMPLEGQNFKQDNKLVYKILKASCLDTDAWPWIEKC